MDTTIFISQIADQIPVKFRGLPPYFRGPAVRLEYSPTSGYVINQKWPPLTGKGSTITYISASVHDSNEITTATQHFRGPAKR